MKINTGALLAYLFTVTISVLFMLFLDGPGGSYLLIALAIGLFISLGVFIWTMKTLSVRVEVSEDILNKNDVLKVNVVLKKQGFLPSCLVKFSFSSSPHFSSDEKRDFCTIIFGQDDFGTEKCFTAVFFGNGKVGINGVTVSDYLGIFSYNIAGSDFLRGIRIYPEIPDISGRDSFARSLTDAVSFDDSEETSQSMVSINGVPGYDHRKYVPGDNLKLINWKLSAKRGELLVRQLEGTGGSEQVFVLVRDDLYFEESQLAAEAMLGLAMIFAKAELPLRVVLYQDDCWQDISVKNPPDLFQLRYKMTDYYIFPLKKYCAEHNCPIDSELRKIAVPDSIDGDRAVIFAPAAEEYLTAFMDKLSETGKECQAAVCTGIISDNRVRRIERDNLSIRFSDQGGAL